MSVWQYIACLVSIIVEAFIIDSFFCTVSSGRKLNKRNTFFVYIIFVIALSLCYIFVKTGLITVVLLLIFIIAMSLFYNQSSQRQIFGSIILHVIISFTELIVGFTLSAILKTAVIEILDTELHFVVGVIVSKGIAYGAIKVFSVFYKKNVDMIKSKMFIMYLFFPILTFLIGVILIGIAGVVINPFISAISAISIMLLALANMLIFYLFEQNIKQVQKESKIELINHSLVLEKNYLEKLVALQNKSNKVEHDIKNQLFAIAGLVQNNDEQAQIALLKICEDITAKQKLILLNNISIDALLNNKIEIMKANNIKFFPELFIGDTGKINDLDMCVVLGNILDNAIDACILNKLEDNKIFLSIKDDDIYIKILIKNSIDKKVEIENNTIITKKKNKFKHGFGIENTKEILKNYNGNIVLESSEEYFFVAIIMEKSPQITT